MISNHRQIHHQLWLEKMSTESLKRPSSLALPFMPITNAAHLFKVHHDIDDLEGAFAALSFRQQRKFNAMRARANGRAI